MIIVVSGDYDGRRYDKNRGEWLDTAAAVEERGIRYNIRYNTKMN